ncbi:cation:proton antiporter [Saccharothrix sp. Mg75]|uniref:cation:proton antiporter n=1 Tax=Saccharothrix sp. Mg75 TaxID=3445357 RepID=UPI003EEF7D88
MGPLVGVAVLVGALVLLGPRVGHGFTTAARFLVAVGVVLAASHLLGLLFARLGQPPVVGEITGGLLVGPSALGAVWPRGQQALFTPEVTDGLALAAQLGVVTFMFLLGAELRLERVTGSERVVGLVVVGSIAVPFATGALLAWLWRDAFLPPGTPLLPYVLFLGIALSITALPVLARILVDSGIQSTGVGTVAIACAAIGDAVAWSALAVVLALTDGGGMGAVPAKAAMAVALVVATALCARPGLAALDRALRGRPRPEAVMLPALVVGAVAWSALSEVVGLHPVIGAFLFGLAVPRDSALVTRVGEQLQGFAVAVLLPLFFAGIGLKTAFGLFGGDLVMWAALLVLLLAAIGSKVVGAAGGALAAGLPRHEALTLGALMNCRGVTELVVVSTGLQHGLVNEAAFTVLVLVALLTTAATGPLVRNRVPRPEEVPT